MRSIIPLCLLLCFCLTSCHLWSQSESNVLKRLLTSQPEFFESVLKDAEKHEIQIIYTQINRDSSNFPYFQTFTFGLDTTRYFYPASIVKFPAALLALEKLNKLNIGGLDRNTSLKIHAAREPQEEVEKDASALDSLPSLGHYIKKMLIVSDNDAFNRIYEFLGQEYLNNALFEKGYPNLRIVHRLSNADFEREDNRYTNPMNFYQNEDTIYQQPEVYNDSLYPSLPLQELQKGKAHIDKDDQKINEPFDFTYKNFISASDMHKMLIATMFPETLPLTKRFILSPDDYNYIYKCMSMLPRESKYPEYRQKYHVDGFAKFFLYGTSKDTIPENIRIFNKVGLAYGFLIDNAYIVDFEAKTEFLLTAVMYTNANQVLNDSRYEYKELSLPFFTNLGRVIAEYERTRPREFLPDLSRFQIDYEE